eukprot:3340737-Pyramimonas_sp.AAC.1
MSEANEPTGRASQPTSLRTGLRGVESTLAIIVTGGVVKGVVKGLTDSFHLRHFSGIRENLRGGLHFSVVKGVTKGLMAVFQW